MKKHLIFTMLATMVLCLIAQNVRAGDDFTTNVNLTYDKSDIPDLITILKHTSVLQTYGYAANYNKNNIPFAIAGWVCANDASCQNLDTNFGNAAFRIVNNPDLNVTYGLLTPLVLYGDRSGSAKVSVFAYQGLNDISNGLKYVSSTNAGYSNPSVNLTLYIKIQGYTLRYLPAGVWTGHIEMIAKNANNQYLGLYTSNITITITDIYSNKIYFPAFPYSSPQVSLNLNTRPGARSNNTVSGHNALDMCLYSGSNVASSINLLFSDEGASATGRPAGDFSVYRDGADKTQPANRIDYQVSVTNPTTGAAQQVSNGTQITWTNTNVRNIQRQVVIPGVSGTSLCVPAPITLTTPGFTMADKTAGHYSGTLRVIYTPST